MEDSIFIPVIISAVLTPNPAQVGGVVHISVAAADLEAVPREEMLLCGEWYCGEV